MAMTIKELHKLFLQYKAKICTDSRKIDKGCIFFALKGNKFDGNLFVKQALDNGAEIAIIDNKTYQITGKTILVKDTLQTLQSLARFHRLYLDIKIIAITGTAGKTTTKELIYQVIKKKFNSFATQGNFNNHIGVPLSLLSLKPENEYAVIEMGASKPDEIWDLCQIALPNMGLITNIGTAHIEGFGSHQVLIRTKAGLYKFLEQNNGLIFQNLDDNLLISLTKYKKIYTYGSTTKADTIGKLLEQNPFVKYLFLGKNKKQYKVQTHLFGKYNFYNLLAATAIGQYLNIEDLLIAQALEEYKPQNNRSQIYNTKKNLLILDLYNANPTSMSKAIESFAQLNIKNKILILGDMLELGNIEEQEHKKILNLIEKLNFSEVYLIGEIFGKVNTKYTHFNNTEQMLAWLEKNPLINKTILLKGSRAIQLERLIKVL